MGGLKRKSSSNAKTLAKSKKKKGPHLPNSILKVIASQKRPLNSDEEDDDDAIDSDDEHGGDLYEYEEGVPEEESRKNNRYDRHDNYDYELPEDFEVRLAIDCVSYRRHCCLNCYVFCLFFFTITETCLLLVFFFSLGKYATSKQHKTIGG